MLFFSKSVPWDAASAIPFPFYLFLYHLKLYYTVINETYLEKYLSDLILKNVYPEMYISEIGVDGTVCFNCECLSWSCLNMLKSFLLTAFANAVLMYICPWESPTLKIEGKQCNLNFFYQFPQRSMWRIPKSDVHKMPLWWLGKPLDKHRHT